MKHKAQQGEKHKDMKINLGKHSQQPAATKARPVTASIESIAIEFCWSILNLFVPT